MSGQTRKLAAIVYTDLARFSELSANDETRAIELINLQREIIHPIIYNKNSSIAEITVDLNRWLEKMIINNPTQWIWSHNRWK